MITYIIAAAGALSAVIVLASVALGVKRGYKAGFEQGFEHGQFVLKSKLLMGDRFVIGKVAFHIVDNFGRSYYQPKSITDIIQ